VTRFVPGLMNGVGPDTSPGQLRLNGIRVKRRLMRRIIVLISLRLSATSGLVPGPTPHVGPDTSTPGQARLKGMRVKRRLMRRIILATSFEHLGTQSVMGRA
jgi:hypothetical protein